MITLSQVATVTHRLYTARQCFAAAIAASEVRSMSEKVIKTHQSKQYIKEILSRYRQQQIMQRKALQKFRQLICLSQMINETYRNTA